MSRLIRVKAKMEKDREKINRYLHFRNDSIHI